MPPTLIMVGTVTVMRMFKKDSIITGHHVGEATWTPFIKETLSVERGEGNQYNKYAVSVVKVGKIVGHMSRSISCLNRLENFLAQHT